MFSRSKSESALREFLKSVHEAVENHDLGKIAGLYASVKGIVDLAQYPPFFRLFAKNMPVQIAIKRRDSPDEVREMIKVFDREGPFASLLLAYINARIQNSEAEGEQLFEKLTRQFSRSRVKLRAVRAWKLFFLLEEIRGDSVDRIDANGRMLAPLFQYWDTQAIPEDVQLAIDRWRRAVGPENHILFNDETARDFIRKNLGPFLLKYYEQCFHPAMKSDFFRLCFLAVRGGVYADADSAPLDKARGFFAAAANRQVFVFRTDRYENRITNMFLCSPQDHGIFDASVLLAADRIRADRREIFEDTGPGLLTDAVLHCLAEKRDYSGLRCMSFTTLASSVAEIISARYKHTDRNWRKARRYDTDD